MSSLRPRCQTKPSASNSARSPPMNHSPRKAAASSVRPVPVAEHEAGVAAVDREQADLADGQGLGSPLDGQNGDAPASLRPARRAGANVFPGAARNVGRDLAHAERLVEPGSGRLAPSGEQVGRKRLARGDAVAQAGEVVRGGIAVFHDLPVDARHGGEDRGARPLDEGGPDRSVARAGVERAGRPARERIEHADAERIGPVDVAGVENDVVLAQAQPVGRHRPAADHDPVGVQHALRFGGRAGGEDEISGVVRRRLGVIRRRGLSGEPERLPPIEDPEMGKERPLLRIGVAEKDRRRAGVRRQRQRLFGGQHRRSRLGDAADARDGEKGEEEIDVVGGADHHPVALPEAALDQPAGEAPDHPVELGVGPGAERIRPSAMISAVLPPRSAACLPRQCRARLKRSGPGAGMVEAPSRTAQRDAASRRTQAPVRLRGSSSPASIASEIARSRATTIETNSPAPPRIAPKAE